MMFHILLINAKMPMIDCILKFMNGINFMLNGVEHENSTITLGPEFCNLENGCSATGCPLHFHREYMYHLYAYNEHSDIFFIICILWKRKCNVGGKHIQSF